LAIGFLRGFLHFRSFALSHLRPFAFLLRSSFVTSHLLCAQIFSAFSTYRLVGLSFSVDLFLITFNDDMPNEQAS
jgi:hypothetical protein